MKLQLGELVLSKKLLNDLNKEMVEPIWGIKLGMIIRFLPSKKGYMICWLETGREYFFNKIQVINMRNDYLAYKEQNNL